jgi:hypothetical protein
MGDAIVIEADLEELIAAEMAARASLLAQEAADDRPPIDNLLPFIAGLASEDHARGMELASQILDRQLTGQGFRAWRVDLGRLPWSDGPARKIRYFRRSEEFLFDAFEEEHPIILAVTAEAQRYIDAVIQRYAGDIGGRPIVIWRASSGQLEVEVIGDVRKMHPWANPNRRLAKVVWEPEMLSEFMQNSGISDADDCRRHLRSNGFDMHDVDGPGPIPPIYFRMEAQEADEDRVAVKVIYDDISAEMEESHKAHYRRWILGILARGFAAENQDKNQTSRGYGAFSDTLHRCAQTGEFNAIHIFVDAHNYLAAGAGREMAVAMNVGVLKDAYHTLREKNSGVQVLLLSADLVTPGDLREEVTRIDLPLPGKRELYVAIDDSIPQTGDLDRPTDDELARLVDAAAGMTLAEVRAVIDRYFRKAKPPAWSDLMEQLRDAKRRLVNRSPALELVASRQLPTIEMGGMERFEEWLETRRRAFEEPESARIAGIERRPRGVLLLGIPGSGKSLAAKIIARNWKLPLVRLDLGAVQDKWLGSSEARMREALKTVEAMAPCVLWIDEIDKGISQSEGVSAHSAEMNTRATLLTWMQENRTPVFIVATANKFASLPPELTRAGRFDARYFFGCPGPKGRERILQIHLSACGLDPEDMDLAALVQATHGFTGAEIEQAILDTLYVAFSDNSKPTSDLLLSRMQSTTPLVKAVGKGLEELWEMVRQGRVEFASHDITGSKRSSSKTRS